MARQSGSSTAGETAAVAASSAAPADAGVAADDPLDPAVVARIIRDSLTRLKHGDLFMEGLGQECYGNLISGDGGGGGEQKMPKNLSKFLSIVAVAMVKAEGGDLDPEEGPGKKRKKRYLKALKLNSTEIERQIRQFEGEGTDQRKEQVGSGDSDVSTSGTRDAEDMAGEASRPLEEESREAPERAKKAEQTGEAASLKEARKPQDSDGEDEEGLRSGEGNDLDDDDDDDLTGDGSSSHSRKRLKKKSKRRHKRKHRDRDKREKEKKKPKKEKEKEKKKRRSKAEDLDELEEDSDDLGSSKPPLEENEDEEDEENGGTAVDPELNVQYKKAKEEFEREKRETLAAIPKEVKSRFRQVCFSSWSKAWLPAVELGPYDVAPGPVRDQWFTMHKNVTKKGQKRPHTRLVYWYGTPHDSPGNAYSFLPHKNVTSYEEAVERNLDKIPAKLQKKMDNGKPLSQSDQHLLAGLKEIKAEVDLDASERLKWTIGWEEEYEYLAGAPPRDDAVEDSLREDDGLAGSEGGTTKKSRKRKKRKKDGDKDEGKAGKKSKKRRKSKDDDELMDEEEADSTSKKGKKSKKRRKTKETKAKETEAKETKEKGEEPQEKHDAMDVVDVLDEEIISEDEEDDEFKIDARSDIESEEEPGEIETSMKKRGKSSKEKTGAPKKKKVEMTEEEKEKAHQEHLARRRERDRQRRAEKKREKEGPLVEEQRRFEECERLFLPIMGRLEKALATDDADIALECLNGLHENVGTISPPFVREHGIGLAIKRTRKALEGHGNIKALCHALTKELKRTYQEKDRFVPKDFKPKKRSIEEVIAEVKGSKPEADNSVVEDTRDEDKGEKDLKLVPPLSPKRIKEEEPMPQKQPDDEPASPKKPKEEISSLDRSVPKKTPSAPAAEQNVQLEAPKTAQSKSSRKAFSLKSMFEGPKPTPKAKDKSMSSNRPPSAVKPAVKKELPTWLVSSTAKNTSLHDSCRGFALEFFVDALRSFPEEKVNPEAAAHALESAVFDYAQLFAKMTTEGSSDRSSEVYWEKVHDISACIAGKRGQGTLHQDILDGVYSSPKEIVKLRWKNLTSSVEGIPM